MNLSYLNPVSLLKYTIEWGSSTFQAIGGKFFQRSQYPLTEREREYYKRIVGDLIRSCTSRFAPHPVFNPNPRSLEEREIYLILFRESESWKTIENMFDKLSSLDHLSPGSKKWVKSWQKHIQDVRAIHTIFHAHAEALMDCSAQRRKRENVIQSLQQFLLNIEYNEHEARLKEDQAVLQARLEKIHSKLVNTVQKVRDEQSFYLKEDPECIRVLNFIFKKWEHLTLFADVPEISMDDKILFPQVHRLYFQSDADLQAAFKKAFEQKRTKAMYALEPSEFEESIIEYKGIEPAILLRPLHLEMQAVQFAPSPELLMDDGMPSIDSHVNEEQETAQKFDPAIETIEKVTRYALESINREFRAGDHRSVSQILGVDSPEEEITEEEMPTRTLEGFLKEFSNILPWPWPHWDQYDY